MKDSFDELQESLADCSQRTQDFEKIRDLVIRWSHKYRMMPEMTLALLEEEIDLEEEGFPINL